MRIKCAHCNVELTDELLQIADPTQLNENDGEDFIGRGQFFISDGAYYTDTETQIVINIKDLKNSKRHSDHSRLNGCCGLAGTDGPNQLCINGHEIATEKSDCWIAHALIFENDSIIEV